MSRDAFASPAWLLHGLTGSSAGWMALGEGRLAFTDGEALVFDVPLGAIDRIRFPWYYFGGGMKLRAEGREYRISFVRPNGAEVATARLLGEAGSPAALVLAAEKIGSVVEGRAAGRRWRELLSRRNGPT